MLIYIYITPRADCMDALDLPLSTRLRLTVMQLYFSPPIMRLFFMKLFSKKKCLQIRNPKHLVNVKKNVWFLPILLYLL